LIDRICIDHFITRSAFWRLVRNNAQPDLSYWVCVTKKRMSKYWCLQGNVQNQLCPVCAML